MKKENYIRKIRRELTLTQKELADKLQVSRSHISMAESGRRNLPSKALKSLTSLLKNDYFSEYSFPESLQQAEQIRLKKFLYNDLLKQRKRLEENQKKLKNLEFQYKKYKKAWLIIQQTALAEEAEEKIKQLKKKLKACDLTARTKISLLVAQLKARIKYLEEEMQQFQ